MMSNVDTRARSLCACSKARPKGRGRETGQDAPVAHGLDETGGLQLQEDVGDDVGPAQHTLQAAGLQGAVRLR